MENVASSHNIITPDEETGIGKWTEEQIATLLRAGTRPDGSQAEMMASIIEEGWKELTEPDALAIAAYLKSIPAVKTARWSTARSRPSSSGPTCSSWGPWARCSRRGAAC